MLFLVPLHFVLQMCCDRDGTWGRIISLCPEHCVCVKLARSCVCYFGSGAVLWDHAELVASKNSVNCWEGLLASLLSLYWCDWFLNLRLDLSRFLMT